MTGTDIGALRFKAETASERADDARTALAPLPEPHSDKNTVNRGIRLAYMPEADAACEHQLKTDTDDSRGELLAGNAERRRKTEGMSQSGQR